jgi:hypothetical protein
MKTELDAVDERQRGVLRELVEAKAQAKIIENELRLDICRLQRILDTKQDREP